MRLKDKKRKRQRANERRGYPKPKGRGWITIDHAATICSLEEIEEYMELPNRWVIIDDEYKISHLGLLVWLRKR